MALTLYFRGKHLFMNQFFAYVTKWAVKYAGTFYDKTSSY